MRSILAFSLLAAAFTRAHALEKYDFQSDEAGMPPRHVDLINAERDGNSIRIVDATTDPVDPIGSSADNKSLYLTYQAGLAWRVPWVVFSLAHGEKELASGGISLDLQVASTGDTPGVIELNLGRHVAKDLPATARVSSVTTLQVFTNSGGPRAGLFRFYVAGKWVDFKKAFPLDVKNEISVRWDVAAHTLSVTLNGEPMAFNNGSAVVSTLPVLDATTPGVTSLRLTAAGESPASCFLDNLSVSPGDKP